MIGFLEVLLNFITMNIIHIKGHHFHGNLYTTYNITIMVYQDLIGTASESHACIYIAYIFNDSLEN